MSHYFLLLLFLSPLVVSAIVNNQNNLNYTTISKLGPFDTNETGRIAGGVPALPNEFPFMAFLELYPSSSTTNPYVCGGTLINDLWVLTSAFCINGMSRIDVTLGITNIASSNRVPLKSYTFVKHPSWTTNNIVDSNIGLIKLPSRVTFTSQIQPINLPQNSDSSDHVNEMVYLAGWGSTFGVTSVPTSQNLLKVTTAVISNSQCVLFYGNSINNADVICTSGYGNVGICPGDNGGPMMTRQQSNTYIQLGVASFYSNNGCLKGNPSGFTRLRNYVDWINSTSGASSSSDVAQLMFTVLLTGVTIIFVRSG